MKVIFAGTPQFAAGHLETLLASHHQVTAVITQPDKRGKRGKKLIPSPVKEVAKAHNLQLLQPEKLSAVDIESIHADIMVVVAYGQILRTDVLELPRLGCVNVHASILPRWRGAAPVQRAILAGDTVTGVTLMQMDEGLDTGDLIDTAEVAIEPGDNSGDIFSKLLEVGGPSLIRVLDDLEAGCATFTQQSDADSTYAKKINKDEANIDWSSSADVIDRLVRAFNPDPIAFTFLDDKRVRIHSGTPDVDKDHEVPAGSIMNVDQKGIEVACGKGTYTIRQIQLPLGKGSVLNPKDVLNGWTDELYVGLGFSSEANV